MTSNRILLPKGVKPISYKLSLWPNMTDFSYKGLVRIVLSVASPVEKIKLHAARLNFDKIRLLSDGKSEELDVSSVSIDENAETAEFPARLEKNSELEIEFSGTISDQMRGFYRSSFVDAQKKSHVVACTQFEPTDARWAFPCWDEPAQKAEFDLAITVPKRFRVLSNMPARGENALPGDQKTVTFCTTPVMSTYLLAWFIGEYSGKTLRTPNGVDVSIFTPPDKLPKAEWALSVAHRTLTFFEEYFALKYPLPKLDMLAINDFVNGAMENWGLVTYRDTAIYCDEGSSQQAREWVTSVVAHELAHQWFGNLVTMEWWSQLWLNEGFATFMQTLANDRLYPKFRVWDSFLAEKLSPALYLDSLASSHPVEVEIANASEINEVFDVISYKKGASVLRMLYEFLGDGAFSKGVSNYLHRHKYSNVDSDALWDSLEEVSGEKVGQMMRTFTRKQGYPSVQVELAGQKENSRIYRLVQSRFLLERNRAAECPTWIIPIRVACGARESTWVTLDETEKKIEINAKAGDTVIFNHGRTGFFRVLDRSPQKEIHDALLSGKVAGSDRFGLLADAKAYFLAGENDAKMLLDLLACYKQEQCQVVWSKICGVVLNLRRIVRNSGCEGPLRNFALELTGPIAQQLGHGSVPGESDERKKLRADILSLRVKAGDQAAIESLKKLFAENTSSPGEIDANLFRLVLSVAVEEGGKEEQEWAQKMAETIEDPARKNQALRALGSSKNKLLLRHALDYGFSEKVKDQDAFFVFYGVAENPEGAQVAWEYFKDNYGALRRRFSHDSLFSRFVKVVDFLDSREALSDAEAFFKQQNRSGYEMNLQQSFESVRIALNARERQLSGIASWLSEKSF